MQAVPGPLVVCSIDFSKHDDHVVSAGEVDRDKLGEMVFKHRAARQKLNSATHIPVALELVRQLAVHWISLTSVAVSGDISCLQSSV